MARLARCIERLLLLGVWLGGGIGCGSESNAELAAIPGDSTEFGGASAGESGSGGEKSGQAGSESNGGLGGAGAAGEAGAGASSGGEAGLGGNTSLAGSAGMGGSNPILCENDPRLDEPNDSEALASPVCLPAPCGIGDRNTNGTQGYGGKLSPISSFIGPDDVDYFTYHGKDESFSVTDPAAKTESSGFRLCMFTQCATETQSHKCVKGDPTVSNGLKLQGCCTTAPGEVESDHDCAGETLDDDSAQIFIRIDNATECTAYDIDLHF